MEHFPCAKKETRRRAASAVVTVAQRLFPNDAAAKSFIASPDARPAFGRD
jgi:hypothetical protein